MYTLRVWNKEVFGYMDLQIEGMVKEINSIEEDIREDGDNDGEKWKKLNSEFWEALLVRKVYWLKRRGQIGFNKETTTLDFSTIWSTIDKRRIRLRL